MLPRGRVNSALMRHTTKLTIFRFIVEWAHALGIGGLSATDLWFRSAVRYFLPGILHATDRGVLHYGGPHSRRYSSIS